MSSIILFSCIGPERPANQAPAAVGSETPLPVQQDLKKQEWYWGSISYVPDIISKLRGTPDGTFLVRDSQNEGEYVIIVRKSGANEVIHIGHSNGMYGFVDTSVLPPKPVLMKFPTILALVEHFRQVPLTEYNASLDVTLTIPVSRFTAVSFLNR